jgi:hypothetical protein
MTSTTNFLSLFIVVCLLQSTILIYGYDNSSTILYIIATSRRIEIYDMTPLRSNIEFIAKSFGNYHLLIYTCLNLTSAISKHWKNWKNLHLIEQGKNHNSQRHSEYRAIRLAMGRNILIERLEKLISSDANEKSSIYTAMIDLDDMMTTPMDKKNFESRMLETKEWDVITFNRKNYYDIWALRYSRYDMNLQAHYGSNEITAKIIRKDIERQLNESIGKYYPVYSTFNGLAVYKYTYTIGCKYNGSSLESGSKYDCEHVAFHKCISARHGGRIMIHVNHIY